LTTLTPQAARRLRRELAASSPSCGTVRWQTWGLDAEVAQIRERRASGRWPTWEQPADDRGAAVERVGGLLAFRAQPSRLREWAVGVALLGDHMYQGMAYVDLDSSDAPLCRADGEMQIFHDYRRRVAVARISRREVLGTVPVGLVPADINPLVWQHNGTVRARRRHAVTT
jgi:hypothetical protein